MNMNVIVLFNSSWEVVGSVRNTGGSLELVEEMVGNVPEIVELLVSEINALGPVSELESARDRFKKDGVRAHILDSELVLLLKQLSDDKFDVNMRNQVVPEILGLDTEHQKAALEAVLAAHELPV